jgi:hypothetical protein
MKTLNPHTVVLSALTALLATACITPFEPAYLSESGGILVVEGMILEGSATVVRLSRSKAPDAEGEDYRYVTDAAVYVLCSDGTEIPLRWNGVKGEYVPASAIDFKDGVTCALEIRADGKQYRSDDLMPLQTPPIEALSYITRNDGTETEIRISTRDQEGKTAYYRWTYEEDWEIRAEYVALLRYDPERMLVVEQSLETGNNRYYCWGRDVSNTVILGNARNMEGGVIKDQVLLQLKQEDAGSRFSYLYSIHVKQYAVSREAYEYFDNMRRNTQNTGSIFSPIPSELRGNIHCLTDPEEYVIGYIPATTEESDRLYIHASDIPGMIPRYYCSEIISAKSLMEVYQDGYGISARNTAETYSFRPVRCVDCTTHEHATKNKPAFWPNDHL